MRKTGGPDPKKIFLRGRIARLPAAPEDQEPAGNPVNRIPPGDPAHPFRAVPSGDTFVLRFPARVSARKRRRRSRATPVTSKELGKHPEIWTARARQVSRARSVRPDRAFVRSPAQFVAPRSTRPVATALLFCTSRKRFDFPAAMAAGWRAK